MPNYFVGKNRTELIDWLLQTWINEGPPVCFVEGFSGVGKTSIARIVMKNCGMRAIMVDTPDANSEQADNLFLNLATELSQVEMPDLADSVTEGKSTDQALGSVLNKPVLIVIDEFQKALDETGKPNALLINFLGRLANRPNMLGRVLLLTNRIIERSKWSEPYAVRTLTGLSPEEAEDLLGKLLNDLGRSNEILQERRRDVVNWLGCNPRAIYVLVASLEKSSLDELIGINPEVWEARDREVSPELLYKLETALLERTIERLLKSETVTLVRRLSVHRNAVKRDAIEKLLPQEAKFEGIRDELISRFLMEQHSGWFSLNPVVREISLSKLKNRKSDLEQAHSFAADHYMRHFQAKEIVDSGKLGGYFVEARYHLVQANRDEELGKIASRFESYLKTKFSSQSSIPNQLEEINERIATLMALLETPGAKGLEFYLARLYEARGSESDLQKALHFIRRATEAGAPADNWVFRLRLEAKFNTPLQVKLVARQGISNVPPDKGVEAIYIVTADLLQELGNPDDAIELLYEGVSKVRHKALTVVYQQLSEILMSEERYDESLAALKKGIATAPTNSVNLLYQSAGKLLLRTGKIEEAIALLKDGINHIPKQFGRHRLLENLFIILISQQNLIALDDLLTEIEMLGFETQQIALGKVARLILLRDWEMAAKVANKENHRITKYRPLLSHEAFCWLCANNLQAAQETMEIFQTIIRPNEAYDSFYWLKAWMGLKQGDHDIAKEYLSVYLNRPIQDKELNELFLIRLWETVPGIKNQPDLAAHFPILPASLTGLPSDLIRVPFGSSFLSQSSKTIQQESNNVDMQALGFSNQNEVEIPKLSSWMDEILNSSETKSRADIGIVIALEEEFRELAPQINFRAYYNQDIRQYYYLFERGSVSPGQKPYHGVATFIGAMGPTDAGIVGDRLISQFNPKTIISIGIAGSTDKDVLVGNVVVADQTDEYLASSKAIETSDKQDWDFQFSGNPFKSDPAYVAHAMNLKYAHKGKMQEWERNCIQNLLEKIGSVAIENLTRERLIGDFPEIQTGHIASGPTVGAAKQFVQWLKEKHDRKLLALEMESAGVLNAAHKRAVSSLIIRGISDYSDERKNKLDGIGQGVLRRYAMNNALSLLWLLMDLGLI